MVEFQIKNRTTPKQAVFFSVVGPVAYGVFLVSAHLFFGGLTWYLVLISTVSLLYMVAWVWAALRLESRHSSIRAHNRFMYLAVALVVVVIVAQWGEEGLPFPVWGWIAAGICCFAAYSVVAFHAVANFISWRKGELSPKKFINPSQSPAGDGSTSIWPKLESEDK